MQFHFASIPYWLWECVQVAYPLGPTFFCRMNAKDQLIPKVLCSFELNWPCACLPGLVWPQGWSQCWDSWFKRNALQIKGKHAKEQKWERKSNQVDLKISKLSRQPFEEIHWGWHGTGRERSLPQSIHVSLSRAALFPIYRHMCFQHFPRSG